MTSILGISAYYHDSAAALIVDGNIVAAAQEERFTRKKHDAGFPSHAISFCLKQAGLLPKDLDYVGFYEKPLVKFERLLETYLSVAPRGFRSFVEFIPSWLRTKLQLPKEIRKGLDGQFKKRIIFTEHHPPHAARPRESRRLDGREGVEPKQCADADFSLYSLLLYSTPYMLHLILLSYMSHSVVDVSVVDTDL